MAKTIAAAGRYPYGICGFLIQGAVLKDGTTLTNARIHKQRNSYDFDIKDENGVLHRSLRITGLDKQGKQLDYSKSDDELINQIRNGHFYVRSMNINNDYGFAIKFFDHKVILSTGIHLYDLVPPTCGLPKQMLGAVYVDTVRVGDTIITGTIMPAVGDLVEDGMNVTVTIGSNSYTGTVTNMRFSVTVPELTSTGVVSINVISPYYKTADVTVPVVGDDVDSDYVTSYAIPSSSFVQQSDGTYAATLLGSTHNRGVNFIVQAQSTTGTLYVPSINYSISTGDIVVNQNTAQSLNLVMIGDSTQHSVYADNILSSDWEKSGSVYTYTIPQSIHNQSDNIVVQLSELISGTDYHIIQEQRVIKENNDVVLTVDDPFDARIVISGK
ncbi:virion structural protein [Xanthomonas phage XaC1]|nr:virion structural protein [Xanthomonas phage XaC1]